MRMRRKKWARPELAVCPFYIEHAEEYKGNGTLFSEMISLSTPNSAAERAASSFRLRSIIPM